MGQVMGVPRGLEWFSPRGGTAEIPWEKGWGEIGQWGASIYPSPEMNICEEGVKSGIER